MRSTRPDMHQWLFLVSGALLVGSVAATAESPPPKPILPEDRLALIRQRVAATLRDPSSAAFSAIVKARRTGYCGYVDARNRFGERTGNRVFYADPVRNVFFVIPSEQEVRGFLPDELDRVERLLPVTEANCLDRDRHPIMDGAPITR
ncbi:hypothetical protein LNAOJCKE_5628 [Methylorubrum aminovorans]|uniref:Uncharacterized protein n=1 Tax=Methylorubrum aminovorans TaxID=269069 RepID=A0ABQ4URL8_9HYPH|nr:hypothetical protein [Methylorubrum aminovorans]GJE68390.1 hypothetical protein LNAOJCKE_5628 [Methylorubrum aminovorans]